MKRMHPYDPREDDLKEDNKLWTTLLEYFWDIDKNIYYTFHGLRCGGSQLEYNNKKLCFSFGEDLKISDLLDNIKMKYLIPNRTIIQEAMKKVSKKIKIGSLDKKDECPF